MAETNLRLKQDINRFQRAPRPKNVSPIEAAIRSWFATLPSELIASLKLDLERLILAAPKRWVVYPPMALLPSGSFGEALNHPALTQEQQEALWKEIITRIGKREGKGTLSHLAINSGIPLHMAQNEAENILRTPSGLVMLYGNFGPELSLEQRPSERDFGDAFWVRTKQNGIVQVWAPRYTMFSRGNVKEKARLVEFHTMEQESKARRVEKCNLAEQVAVDLYAGIGYFVFSYVAMGMKRVLGWELNPWSVEGLRRGAIANGWSVRVVNADESWEDSGEKIVVFLEDNRKAAQRLGMLDGRSLGRVSHVNGGLLPTSESSWEMSLSLLDTNGWLHLHENVGVHDVERRKEEVEVQFREWIRESRHKRQINIEHVEFVKTFAPGVWHCVFDLYISNL